MLEYLFTSQKRARLPTDKTRLPVTPDTASTAGDFPCSAQCNSRPALQPGSPDQAEVKHAKVQHQTLQDLTFWHPDSLEQVKILALTYVRLTQVGMGSSGTDKSQVWFRSVGGCCAWAMDYWSNVLMSHIQLRDHSWLSSGQFRPQAKHKCLPPLVFRGILWFAWHTGSHPDYLRQFEERWRV